MAKRTFIVSSLFLMFCVGVAVGKYKVFPYGLFHQANVVWLRILDNVGLTHSEWGYTPTPKDLKDRPSITQTTQLDQGFNLITEMGPEKALIAKVMGMDGEVLKEWKLDCFEIWDNFEHLDRKSRPKWQPGAAIHGAVVLDDGSLVFNHSAVGLCRVGKDDKIIWTLPYFTHHSVHLHDDGVLWVCGRKYTNQIDGFENDENAQWKFSILRVSVDGEILQEWLVDDWLLSNGYSGLIDLLNCPEDIKDDFHLNDVEPLPDSLAGESFEKGDVLVSLRNINTVFIYNIYSGTIRLMLVGKFVRQHDPDFLNKHVISIFDNKNGSYLAGAQKSRILLYDLQKDSFATAFEGSHNLRFITTQGGKHQWLPNGHILITEARRGRVIEINAEGKLVWEYINKTAEDEVGFVTEAQRLPKKLGKLYSAH